MDRKPIETFDHYPAVMRAMQNGGLLLGAYDRAGKANFMTIGWGMLGYSWKMPIWTVLVRPSRYTFDCIEHATTFTVNVPTPDMAKAVGICGTQSGRDIDKVAVAGLGAELSSHVNAPVETHSPIVYHCKVVSAADLEPDRVDPDIASVLYPSGDYHRVYFGDVQATEAAANVQEMLGL
jgi:flavin reductase (DIM6/NTAB) family NADH-FMN oxidoreductase RutF